MKSLLIKLLLLLILTAKMGIVSSAQSLAHELSAGVKLQKAIHLYWENGFTVDYTNSFLLEKHLLVGVSYYTSRLGTAYHSNAIKQDNYLLSFAYVFRNQKVIQPLLKLNGGYFYSDMEEEIFEVLPHTSPLLSLEGGVAIQPKYPVKLSISFGYNFITGDGISGPGTLYPFFYQISLQYVLQL